MAPSGQIEKRLKIIQIAISITDNETVTLQRLKLMKYKDNKQLENILSVLDDENFALASNLIDHYLQNPHKEVTPTPPPSQNQRDREEEELIKKFGLFEEAGREKYPSIEDDEMFSLEALKLNETALSEEIENETVIPPQPTTEEIMERYNMIEEDQLPEKEIPIPTSVEDFHKEEDQKVEEFEDTTLGQNQDKEEYREEIEESIETDPKQETQEPQEREKIEYAPISYIDQKIRNMINQYPQVVENSEQFPSEERLLDMIRVEGYTDEDIEKSIISIYALEEEGKLDEAAHLLLIVAATESLYAQFILARELFKGNIIQKNLSEAFTQINRLALDDYPEAVCDLAQFYEHGIGIEKNRKKAFNLYEDALDLGVERADIHLTRMENESKGILGGLFGK
ncbi:MAG: hypothetical protein U9R27_07020 [Campylobacterota bacterium]|nr:hypothetical protein [Campylobacterota bacterium]